MGNDRTALGKASLWTAIIGIVLPGCLAILAILVDVYLAPPGRMGAPWYAPAGAMPVLAAGGSCFAVLELVALGCGIAARGTAPGKAGLVASSILLLVGLVLPVLGAVAILLLAPGEWFGH